MPALTSSAEATYQASAPQVLADPIPFTFGVELEFLFNIDNAAVEEPRNKWLHVDRDDKPQLEDAEIHSPHEFQAHEQIARILRRDGLPIRVQNYAKQDFDFGFWSITSEMNADLQPDHPLEVWSGGRITSDNRANWESAGMELVSRVLPAPPPGQSGAGHKSLAEIEKYTTALRGSFTDPFISVAEVENSGLHVHVGIPQSQADKEDGVYPDMPLPLLQHLSYILAQYEDIISSFHHPQRRGYNGTKTVDIAMSNLMGIRKDDHTCGKPPLPSRAQIAGMIFAPGMQIRDLMKLMGSRGNPRDWADDSCRFKFVNFEYLDHQQRAKTVEFRQHCGTLDHGAINHWVRFVVALMRAAERKLNEGRPPPSYSSTSKPPTLLSDLIWSIQQPLKYRSILRFRRGDQRERTKALFQLLELDREQEEYWLGCARKYKCNELSRRSVQENCPACVELRGSEAAALWTLEERVPSWAAKEQKKNLMQRLGQGWLFRHGLFMQPVQ